MAKAVGLSRAIKTEWCNKTVELVLDGVGKNEIKNELDHYLSFELDDPTNIGKARNILMNMWVNDCDESKQNIRKIALSNYTDSDNRVVYNWCMLLLAYPVFVEWTKILGKLATIQEGFTASQLKKLIYDQQGEKTTLQYATEKLLQTAKQFGVLCSEGKGKYSFSKQYIHRQNEKLVILKSILEVCGNDYYAISELESIPQMFPFRYEYDFEFIKDNSFSTARIGDNIVVIKR